jgi:hypothetical protein
VIGPGKDATRLRWDAVLPRGETLTGKLVDPDGKEVKGARGWGLDGHIGWSQPLKSGQFRVRVFNRKKPRFIAFTHPDRGLAAVLRLPADSKGAVVVKLQKGGTLAAQVVDAGGKPRAGLVLAAYLTASAETAIVSHFPEVFRTDSRGQFRLSGLLPGTTYVIQTNDGQAVVGWYRLRPGETKDLGAVKLREP